MGVFSSTSCCTSSISGTEKRNGLIPRASAPSGSFLEDSIKVLISRAILCYIVLGLGNGLIVAPRVALCNLFCLGIPGSMSNTLL